MKTDSKYSYTIYMQHNKHGDGVKFLRPY